MDKDCFYITTTLPYVNSDPHIGFALEIVQADVIARYKRLLGFDVFFNTGTDEHGQKVYKKALEEGKNPQEYVDEYAAKFANLRKALNLSYNSFIRTTDKHHKESARKLWEICAENGFIKKGVYKSKYCVGCELEKKDSELEKGKCPIHPNFKIEVIEEENYFFKFSDFQEKLLYLYRKRPDFVIPGNRLKEIVNFVEEGLSDFSVSRLREKMPWGIPVPGDEKHVMYVWFDALTNYISALGWPGDMHKFERFWGKESSPQSIQFAGKDNLRQQSAMWQAMLMAANLPTSKNIIIHGFIESEGKKMSKSLGNVVDPFEYVNKYGTDAVRYFLLSKIHPFKDGDFTRAKFEKAYNFDLANKLGNLVNRVVGLTEKFSEGKVPEINRDPDTHPLRTGNELYTWKKSWKAIDEIFETYRFDRALESVWSFIGEADRYIEVSKPWELSKKNKKEELAWVIYGLCDAVHQLAWQILPFLPETAGSIAETFDIRGVLKENPQHKDSFSNIASHTKINSKKPLFPRLK